MFNSIIENIKVDGLTFVFGNEKSRPLDSILKNHMIYHHHTIHEMSHLIELLRDNLKFDILRISYDVDTINIFNFYNELVTDGGIIIIDNHDNYKDISNLVKNKIASYIKIYEDEFSIIYQRSDVKPNIKFAIVLATYYRESGITFQYVKRSLTSIANQSYKNYKVFLVGDKYTKIDEFESYAKFIDADKFEAFNLPFALERENCTNIKNLWCIGGANAMNYGVMWARKQGFSHYVHIDDDDFWHTFHLRNVALGYTKFPEANLVCTYGVAINGFMLPKITGLGYNNFECKSSKAYHSTWGFRIDKIDYIYTTLKEGENDKDRVMEPADANMLDKIGKLHKVLGVPIISCFHDFEGAVIKQTHKIVNKYSDLSLEIRRSRSDLIVKNISNKIKTFHHHYHLLYDLRTLLGPDSKNYLEIGTYYGASAALMLSHPYYTNIMCVDIFQFSDQYQKVLENLNFNNRVTIHKSDSRSLELHKKLLSLSYKIDILFIDGDHNYNAVIEDYKLFSPFVNKGGYIVFDDYNDNKFSPDVKKAVDYIIGNLNGYEIIGTFNNFLNVYPSDIKEYNEFILKKL